MANTLDWDDDLDAVEGLVAVEQTFAIHISDEEARHICNVGDIWELILQKRPARDEIGKCASAMTFYRLRKALAVLHHTTPLKPDSDLGWLDRLYTKAFVDEVKTVFGLNPPKPAYTWMGNMGCLFVLLPIVWPPLGGYMVEKLSFPSSLATLLFFASWVPAWLLFKADPGRLPRSVRTMDELVEKTSIQSYGQLVLNGADARDVTLWKVFVAVLAEHTELPQEEITRDTVCLRSTFNRLAKMAV